MTKQDAIRAVHRSLSDDLMRRDWLEKRQTGDHFTFGHCYLGAETLYHLWGKELGYKPKVLSGPGWTHWFLIDDKGDIADPTAGQWKDERIPYERGRGDGFLTGDKPSRRCRIMLERIRR